MQGSLFDNIEPVKPVAKQMIPTGSSIEYQNGNHVCEGKVLDYRVDGKWEEYLVIADQDTPDTKWHGYSKQWIIKQQIL